MISIPVNGSVLVKGGIGSGKTVMMKSMMSLIPPSSSNVTVISRFVEEYKALKNAGLIQNLVATSDQAEQAIIDTYKNYTERYERYENGANDMQPVYLFVDDAPIVLKDISDESTEFLASLVSRGRIVNISVIVGGNQLDEDFEARFPVKIDTENGFVNYRNSPMLVAQ